MVVNLFYSCFLPVFCIFVTKSTWDQSIYEVGQLYFELIMKTLIKVSKNLLILVGCAGIFAVDVVPAPGSQKNEEEYNKDLREALRGMRPFIDQPEDTPISDGKIPTLGGDKARLDDGRPEEDGLLGLPAWGKEDKAIMDALDWLTEQQKNEEEGGGYWLETDSRVAHTGLALLAYMAYGSRHDERGAYREPLETGLGWLVGQVRSDGSMMDGGKMYDQGIGTYAIAEAYRITQDEKLKEPLAKAMAFLIAAQDPKGGGWRYSVHQPGDLSVSAWVIGALVTGHVAGVPVDVEVRRNALRFLDSVSGGGGQGLYKYMPEKEPKATMVAAGLFSYQMLVGTVKDKRVSESVSYIMSHLPDVPKSEKKSVSDDPFYYWYNATLALRLHGTDNDAWKMWREKLNKVLVETQVQDGSEKHGSWDPKGVRADKEGRIVTTTWTCITLLAPERHSSDTPMPPADRPGLPGQ